MLASNPEKDDQPKTWPSSHPASSRPLKPLYLTDPFQSHSQVTPTNNAQLFNPTNQNNGYHTTPTRTRRTPSLNFLTQHHFTQTHPASLSHSISSINSSTVTPGLTRSRRPTLDSKQSRSCSVSVLRPFTPNHLACSRSMSLTHSPLSSSPSSHHQGFKDSKTSPNPARSTIPYSKSNSISFPPTSPYHLHQHPQSNATSNLPHTFCSSPPDIQPSNLDSEIDSLLASMIDCAKSFGIQEELKGIVDI